MELKPENKPIDGVQPNKVDAPAIDLPSEPQVADHHTSTNTDPSVSLGSPMSTSSLPLSTQAASTQTPSNAQRPGERLRQARLLKNRDLKEIAAELNISERLLTAIEADDYGFYINGDGVPSISVNSGDETKITFNVKTQNVYYGGLDFRGCGQNAGKINPGSSTIVEFTASENCTITSYWPLSGVVKTNLKILVN